MRVALASKPTVDPLEGRQLLSGVLPDIALVSATTADSQSVTIVYDIKNAPSPRSIDFGVLRSADATLSADDPGVGTVTVAAPEAGTPTLDADGQPATAIGHHEVTLALPGGLPPNPLHPYVLVVADPKGTIAESDRSNDVASFRKETIAVVTHGGLQNQKWKHTGPPWERAMAAGLKAQGYDTVIAYNWVSESGHPGAAAKQGPRVVRQILKAAAAFPAGDPVDVHLIGHSEGAVVNSRAAAILQRKATAPLNAGFLKMTMLDPHSASDRIPSALQYSATNKFVVGDVTRMLIDAYQSRANDPPAVVTPNVDAAEVFFQRTPAALATGSNHGLYNLWGNAPVRGTADYYNLTGPGISHAGDFGVPTWYMVNVVPTLGDGGAFVSPNLTGHLDATAGAAATIETRGTHSRTAARQATYSGAAAPGVEVRLHASRADTGAGKTLGETVSNPDGSWSITTPTLAPGQYRIVATARVPADPRHPRILVTPRTKLGTLAVLPGG